MELLQRLKLSVILFLLFLLLAFLPMTAQADGYQFTDEEEFMWVISVLRGWGYHHFANALQMVDITHLFSSGGSYTFFAPPDEALEALGSASKSWQEYMDAVQYHIVNVQLSYYNLKHLPDGARLGTLLRNRSLTFTTFAPESENEALMVNNVAVSFPDLYYDRRFAAHGLTAVLNPSPVDHVDVLSIRAFWKKDATVTASWDRVKGLHGKHFAPSKLLPVSSFSFKNTSVNLTTHQEILTETGGHKEDSSTASVLPAPAPSPCDEVAANGSTKEKEVISSKKTHQEILTESGGHKEDSSTTPVLPAPAPSPYDEIAANSSTKVKEAISSKKTHQEILTETGGHKENSSIAPVLPPPAPSPCDEVAANGSTKVKEAISSKKVSEVIYSTTSSDSPAAALASPPTLKKFTLSLSVSLSFSSPS